MGKYKKELVQEVAETLAGYGYEVYIAHSKEYGFYTDGEHVVSFGGCWEFCLDFSGNYVSKHCGTNWQIAKEQGAPTKEEAENWIKTCAPAWATHGEAVKLTTPEQHLKTYGNSSKYTRFENGNGEE